MRGAVVTDRPRADAERALRSARQRLDRKLAELGVQYVTADEHGL